MACGDSHLPKRVVYQHKASTSAAVLMARRIDYGLVVRQSPRGEIIPVVMQILI
jgi:hypothetical protein